jgi:hypothetical protein
MLTRSRAILWTVFGLILLSSLRSFHGNSELTEGIRRPTIRFGALRYLPFRDLQINSNTKGAELEALFDRVTCPGGQDGCDLLLISDSF